VTTLKYQSARRQNQVLPDNEQIIAVAVIKGVIGRNLAFSNWSVIFVAGRDKNRLQCRQNCHMIMGMLII
jgi:hypothetical protein